MRRIWLLSPLLMLGAGACAAPLAADYGQGASLVTADWRGARVVGEPPCPVDAICLNAIVEARLRNVREVAGPAVPSALTARLEIHAEPACGNRIVLLVRRPPAGAGAWQASWLTGGRAGDISCVESSLLAANAVPVPPGAELRDGSLCFRL